MGDRATIERIAEIAEAVGWQAGVSGVETAGQIVSYLARNPDQIEAVLENGILDLPADWWRQGRLTWLGMNGKIVRPQQARFAALVRAMEKGK